MNTYYVVCRAATEFLSYVTNNYISFGSRYYDAIQLSTQAMATEFKNYCQLIEPDNTFKIYRVQINISEVTLTQVGN